MQRLRVAGALFLAMLPAAAAQDGGTVPWRGRDGFPKSAFADAVRDGRPMMMFFSSEGSADCKKLCEGAFSLPAVAKAAEQLACIFVECGAGQNADYVARFNIRGFPTVLFCDPTGKPVDSLKSGDPAAVLREINAFAARFSATGPASAKGPRASFAVLRDLARKAGRLLAILAYDDSPPSVSVNEALKDPILTPTLSKFVLGTVRYEKGNSVAIKFNLDRAPSIIVMDPTLEVPEEKPIDIVAGSRNARELKRDLEAILEAHALARVAPDRGDGAAGAPKGAEEKLSDDEVDRRFIEARITVAQDFLRRDQKARAIEILEDVLKTYPKHVATRQARELLADLRK